MIVGSTGFYLVLSVFSSYEVEFLTSGVDYSSSIERVVSGPFAREGQARQAQWNLLNPAAPLANPAEIPPPDQWV